MKRAYYIISKYGSILRHAPTPIHYDFDEETIITLVQGWMFADGWDNSVPYAIYLEKDNEFKPIAGSKELQDIEDEIFAGEEKENFLKENAFDLEPEIEEEKEKE